MHSSLKKNSLTCQNISNLTMPYKYISIFTWYYLMTLWFKFVITRFLKEMTHKAKLDSKTADVQYYLQLQAKPKLRPMKLQQMNWSKH